MAQCGPRNIVRAKHERQSILLPVADLFAACLELRSWSCTWHED